MENQILKRLENNLGKSAWVSIGSSQPVLAGIHLIDYTFNTVTLINGKGSRELRSLRDRGNVLIDEENAILQNPENFNVIPIKEIIKVETPG
jgi:hypothetical protein